MEGQNGKKLNKAVIKDLKEEFQSSQTILEAAVASNNPTFDDAVVFYLKIYLNVLLCPPQKNFFSAQCNKNEHHNRRCIFCLMESIRRREVHLPLQKNPEQEKVYISSLHLRTTAAYSLLNYSYIGIDIKNT